MRRSGTKRHRAAAVAGRFAAVLALLALPAAAQVPDPAACLVAPYEAPATPAQAEIAALVAGTRPALNGFPSLAEALDGAGVRICLMRGPATASGYFAPGSRVISLHDSLSPDMRRVVLLHELRHLDQTARGACPGNTLSRQSYAAAVQAMEADASATVALVAWAWREAGTPGPWEAFAAWPTQADIAARFAAEMADGAAPWQAVSAAFEQWYDSPRRRDSYWFSACSAYLDRQDDSHALPSYDALDAAFWADLCVLPDGQRYDCPQPD